MPKALRLLRHTAPTTRQSAAIQATDPPTMPDGLSLEEQACWRGLMAELATVPGLASRADRGVCELVSRLEPALRAAAVVLREQGATVTCLDQHGEVKFLQQRPEAGFALKTAALLKSLYAELGLTPSGRCRVSLSPAPAASKLDTFLGRKHGA